MDDLPVMKQSPQLRPKQPQEMGSKRALPADETAARKPAESPKRRALEPLAVANCPRAAPVETEQIQPDKIRLSLSEQPLTLAEHLLGEESEDLLPHLFAGVQHFACLPNDDESAFRYSLGCAFTMYQVAFANRDLQYSSSAADNDRWYALLDLLDEKMTSCAAAHQAMVDAEWIRVIIPRRGTVAMHITHRSREGSVKARVRANRGAQEVGESMPCMRFAEAVVRSWGRQADSMGTTAAGGARATFECIHGESLEFSKEEGSQSLLVRLVAEVGAPEIMSALINGSQHDAYVQAATGRRALLDGNFEAAARSYSAAFEADPTSTQFEQAQARCERLAEMQSRHDLGTAAIQEGRPNDALEHFVAATKFDSRDDAGFLERSQLYEQAEQNRQRGPGFMLAAAQSLMHALKRALEPERLPEDADLPMPEQMCDLAVRFGETGRIWLRAYEYFNDAWRHGRSGIFTLRYTVLGRPGAANESGGEAEQRGFDVIKAAAARAESDASSGSTRVDKDVLCMNIQETSNADDTGKVTGTDARDQDMYDWGYERVGRWMKSKPEIAKYAEAALKAQVSGKTLSTWRSSGGEGWEEINRIVSSIGINTKAAKEQFLKILDTQAPKLRAVYLGSVRRDKRDEFLIWKFKRAVDDSYVTGRGRDPNHYKATGVAAAGLSGDLVWTINQWLARESFLNVAVSGRS